MLLSPSAGPRERRHESQWSIVLWVKTEQNISWEKCVSFSTDQLHPLSRLKMFYCPLLLSVQKLTEVGLLPTLGHLTCATLYLCSMLFSSMTKVLGFVLWQNWTHISRAIIINYTKICRKIPQLWTPCVHLENAPCATYLELLNYMFLSGKDY